MNPKNLCQIEIPVRDLKAALEFYGKVFGWKPVPAEMHNYVVLDVPSDCPYGLSLLPIDANISADKSGAEAGTSSNRSSFTLYFEAENPEEILERVEPAGGKKRLGPKSLPGYGTVWQFLDLDGNCFGLFKKK